MAKKEEAKKEVLVSVIGSGFMGGKTHPLGFILANSFTDAHKVRYVLDKIYGTSLDNAQQVADRWGFRKATSDLDEAIEGADLVDICTPNFKHPDVAKLAADAEVKYIHSEKPLAADVAGAQAMVDAVNGKNIITMVDFCYRFAPAIQLARRWIDEGRIRVNDGEQTRFSSQFLQDWGMDRLMGQEGEALWRFNAEQAGESGVWGDLGSHGMDLICYLLDQRVASVSADTKILVDKRPGLAGKPPYDITAIDAANVHVRLENESRGDVDATRFATGHKAFFENKIHGYRGALSWELENLPYLKYYANEQQVGGGEWKPVPSSEKGWKDILVTNKEHYPKGAQYMVPGLSYGYDLLYALMYVEFAKAITGALKGKPAFATFEDGLHQQLVGHAVVASGKNKSIYTNVN